MALTGASLGPGLPRGRAPADRLRPARRDRVPCGRTRRNESSAARARTRTPPGRRRPSAPGGRMRIRLIPREERFFDMFVEDAANVLSAARHLEEMLQTYEDVEQRAKELFAMEHHGDELSHAIGSKLNTTFVTPFDREDIHALISGLDDVLDLIEEIADTFILYHVDAPWPASSRRRPRPSTWSSGRTSSLCSRTASTSARTWPTSSRRSSSSMPEGITLTLLAVFGLAVGFDYINGFPDTANSIATSVSTRALQPH